MARKRIIKRYRKKSRYSPNISEFSELLTAPTGTFSFTNILCTNPAQTTLGVSQQYTVKNFEISFTFETEGTYDNNLIEDIAAYIMYKPQGMNVSATYNLEHPEYIMSYKYYGSPINDNYNNGLNNGQQFQPLKIRTRMARKLQTGDSIILFIKGVNENLENSIPLKIHGILRWWSKAN